MKQEKPCFTCEIVSEYTGLANEFTQDLSAALLGPMWTLFISLATLWVVIQGLRLVMGHAGPVEVFKEFVFVMIAGFLLSGQGPELVNNIYTVSLAMMGSAASVALQVGDDGSSVTANATGAIPLNEGMTALVRKAEEGVTSVFDMAGVMVSATAWDDWTPIIYALVLVVPYFLVLVVYFSQVVIAIFRVMMLATISPFLMLGFGFNWGREMTKSGFKTLLSAFMVLFGATAALAVMLYGVSSLDIGEVPEEQVRKLASISNPKFLLAVAMGWLGTAFMTEATGMANSIAGSSLTNTGTGVITAGASATAMALKSNPVSQFLGKSASDMAGGAAWNTVRAAAFGTGATLAALHDPEAASQSAGRGVNNLISKAKDYGAHVKKWHDSI